MKRTFLFGILGLLVTAAAPTSTAQESQVPTPQPQAEQRAPRNANGQRGNEMRQQRRFARQGRRSAERGRRGRGMRQRSEHARGSRSRMQRGQHQRLRSLSTEQREALRERLRPLQEEERAFREQMQQRRQTILDEFVPPAQDDDQ